ncbi:MAG TPA: molecular chaperone HtpG [Candidatus Avacidaminococcus intestinavium]|uniref:Chaperone protein HtpG n=1 Tax=Candidatus Avacidaminococcus intestinavium TaxID=2840684 RepID=A0A9D1SL07_9FIRM|nr:molecular chaperone HtpG [Candidatus Avacidaminococcus intestinavium]
MARKKFQFKAETKQLLDLMINSIYTNREIFLRELISNASDALDKLRYEALTNKELLGDNLKYEIRLLPDATNHTLTIIDTGIGMSKEDLIDNIGTIAKSGTKAFMTKLQEAQENKEATTDKEMIGQFGVGFYSAFMVADQVSIVSRKAGEDIAYKWQSTGDGSFTIEESESKLIGTEITLQLASEFFGEGAELNLTDTSTLQHLVKKYSDYVRYPIKMDFTVEETPKDEAGKPLENAEKTVRVETRTLNSMQPLWSKNKKDIKQEEYDELYKSLFHDWEAPLTTLHTKAEGTVEYTSLLFIPSHAPFNLYHTDYEPGLQLYSRHVFIMNKCKDLLPDYLRFVQGLVDSPDLSLNISRELLQQDRQLKLIGKNLEKNVLSALTKMLTNEREKYEKFWQEFGRSIKIGVYNSVYGAQETLDKLKDLLLFATSSDTNKLSSLKEYKERMPETQKKIYYANGKDRQSIEHLPQMELLRDKGIEVLYLYDPVDEFALEVLNEYDKVPFQSISRGDLGLDDVETQEKQKKIDDIAKTNEDLLKDIKAVLGDKIAEAHLSNRLKSSAVCLVAAAEGPSLAMEQAFAATEQHMFKAKRILELNPEHDLFSRLQKIHETEKDSDDFKDYCQLLYDQALLIEGIMPDDPIAFADKVARLMSK